MSEHAQVSIVRCEEYGTECVDVALVNAVGLLGGIRQFVRPGQRVVLKVNLCRPMKPEALVTTHPSVVRAVARLVQEAGATPIIADSPGGVFTEAILRRVYRRTGMAEVATETGATLNFDTDSVQVPHPQGRLLHMVDLIRVAVEADAVISVAKFKTHNLTRITGATKNLFGLVPGMTKIAYHSKLRDATQFARGLIDILSFVRPTLSILDGVVAMHGDGPSGGDPYEARLLLAGNDALAVDMVAAGLAGWDPLSMPPVQVAKEWGLTTGKLADIEVLGESLESARLEGFRPGIASRVDPGLLPNALRALRPLLTARTVDGGRAGEGQDVSHEALDVGVFSPVVREWITRQLIPFPRAGEKCTACGYCIDHCPVGAIQVVDGRAQMDLNACIRCYCCHELCPNLAVELQRSLLGRTLFGK